MIRGLTSLALGLTIGLIGIDTQTGQARLAFGIPDLLDKIDVTTVAVAMFAMGEALYLAAQGKRARRRRSSRCAGSLWMTASDWARSWKAWLRGTAIGFPIGAMPAGGAEIGTFLSYATEKRLSKHKEEFGEGAIEGVAGPEAANNASAAGTLVPLLTLGLPTTATAAIMLAGLPAVRAAAGAAALPVQPDAGLGADREPPHRQLDADRAQPAADRALGAAADDPAAVALCGHPAVRDARHARLEPVGLRARRAARLRPSRLRAARSSTSRSRR